MQGNSLRGGRPLLLVAVLAALLTTACGGGEPAATSEAFCDEARGMKEDSQRLAGEDARQATAARFTRMFEVAPEAVKADVEVLRDMWVDAEKNKVVVAVGGPDAAESIKPYSEWRARHPKVVQAGPAFQSYVHKECNFFF